MTAPLPTSWPAFAPPSESPYLKPKIIFTDIDDTLTWDGRLPLETFEALYRLKAAGIKVVPVTGGSAGWADCLIRTWPIETIITENGSLWLEKDTKGLVTRHFFLPEEERKAYKTKLDQLRQQFHQLYPTIPPTQDQDFRLTDIAYDIGQQVSIKRDLALEAADWWINQGAEARCSSIHINIWMGRYNKALGALRWLENHACTDLTKEDCLFIGDSPNDEAMFQHFPVTVGVANIGKFLDQLQHKPHFLTHAEGGFGFVELTNSLLSNTS